MTRLHEKDTNDKVKFIRDFITKNSNINLIGWKELCDLWDSSLYFSSDFRVSLEKQIDSVYEKILNHTGLKEKEKRIPALHTKGILCRYSDQSGVKSPYPRHFLRVNDDSEEGFTDYAITHYGLEVMILNGSAEFIQNEKGNFLDYTKEAMSPSPA